MISNIREIKKKQTIELTASQRSDNIGGKQHISSENIRQYNVDSANICSVNMRQARDKAHNHR